MDCRRADTRPEGLGVWLVVLEVSVETSIAFVLCGGDAGGVDTVCIEELATGGAFAAAVATASAFNRSSSLDKSRCRTAIARSCPGPT